MRLIAVIVVLLAGCTPLRALEEPADAADMRRDTGARLDGGLAADVSLDAPVAMEDAVPTDAPRPIESDVGPPDAWAPDGRPSDAPPPDAAMNDADARDTGGDVTPSMPGELVVSEVMVTPNGGDDQQWFELHNPSSTTTYELVGCHLDGIMTTFTIPSSVRVPPGAYIVLAASASPGFAPDFVYGRGTFGFLRDRDRVALVCDGVVIDEVAYDLRFPVEPDQSMMVLPAVLSGPNPHIANDGASAWCVADGSLTYARGNAGTPGDPNVCR